MNPDYLIGWLAGNVLMIFVALLVLLISVSVDRQRSRIDRRQRELRNAEAQRLKVLAIEDFRRRERAGARWG